MKITWLGQAGLLFENETVRILVDPYLSDSVAKTMPQNARRIPVDERFLKIKPDVLLLTHDHLDHTDPETLAHYFTEDAPFVILASAAAWGRVRPMLKGQNPVYMTPGTVWTEKDITFYALPAAHSETTAIGFLIDDGEKTYYLTGDTLYHFDVIDAVRAICPDGPDVVFLPINGVGNNMNMTDAADFADEIGAKTVVPLHFGLFDDLDPGAMQAENKIIPSPFRAIELP